MHSLLSYCRLFPIKLVESHVSNIHTIQSPSHPHCTMCQNFVCLVQIQHVLSYTANKQCLPVHRLHGWLQLPWQWPDMSSCCCGWTNPQLPIYLPMWVCVCVCVCVCVYVCVHVSERVSAREREHACTVSDMRLFYISHTINQLLHTTE